MRPGVDAAGTLLARHAMPEEWRCVLAIPKAEPGLSGRARRRGSGAALGLVRAALMRSWC